MVSKKQFEKLYGSRAQVWRGTAKMTKGRLTKKDFIKNKHGRIVSKKKSLDHSRNENKNPLLKQGYQQKKGSKTFGPLNPEEKDKNKKTKSSKSNKSKKNKSNKSNNNNNNKTYLKKMGNAFFKMF